MGIFVYVLKGKLRIPTFSQPSITYWNATMSKNKAQKISREKTCSPRLRLHRAVEGKETNRYLRPYFKCWSKGNESRCFRREERGITDGWRWELKNCIGETSDLLERQVEFCLMLASTLLRVTGWGNTICKKPGCRKKCSVQETLSCSVWLKHRAYGRVRGGRDEFLR